VTGAKDGLPPLREVIRRHGLKAKQSLGQNFLFDLNLTERIARAAEPLAGATVYEVGPGPGGLTRALLALGAARVIAVERDDRAIAALQEIAAHYPGRLDIVAADALNFDPRTRFDRTPARIQGPAPRIGEHSATILAELGFEAAEIERLATEKIVRLVKA